MYAARNGHNEVVRALLSAPGIDVNKADNNGGTAVIQAASKGHTEVVRALLAVPGIDVNKADDEGSTAVIWAAQKGHTEVVALLRAAGAMEAPNLLSTFKLCRLGAQQPFLAPVTALPTFSFGAPAPAPYNPFGSGAQAAFGSGGLGAARGPSLFNLGARAPPPPPASATDVTGQRIYEAARDGDMAALRPLVQEWSGNEDVLNWANHKGWTPLFIGSYHGKAEAVKLLLATPGETRCCFSCHTSLEQP